MYSCQIINLCIQRQVLDNTDVLFYSWPGRKSLMTIKWRQGSKLTETHSIIEQQALAATMLLIDITKA